MPTLRTFIQRCLGLLVTATGQEKRIKGVKVEQEEVNLSLFADGMMLSTEILNTAPQKLLE